MTFSDQLTDAKGDLSAREVASLVSPLLSHRTVEDWLQGRRTPPEWAQAWIIARAAKRPRRRKGQNDKAQARREQP